MDGTDAQRTERIGLAFPLVLARCRLHRSGLLRSPIVVAAEAHGS